MSAAPPWLRAVDGGVTVALAVQPGAKKCEILGVHGAALKMKVAAPPVEGAANAALIRFIAARCGVRERAVRLLRGATSRQKVIKIDGLTLEMALAKLAPTC